MSKEKINIKIKGVQGSGKTFLLELIRQSLENQGYHSTRKMPNRKHEDIIDLSNDFHDIEMVTEQSKKGGQK